MGKTTAPTVDQNLRCTSESSSLSAGWRTGVYKESRGILFINSAFPSCTVLSGRLIQSYFGEIYDAVQEFYGWNRINEESSRSVTQ